MNRIAAIILVLALLLAAAGTWAWHRYQNPDLDAPSAQPLAVLDGEGRRVGDYMPPPMSGINELPNAEQVMLGRRLLNETARLLPENVGNGLNCNSCHMAQGKRPFSNHYLNAAARYPRFMPRPGKPIDLVQRINGCFQRSMDGHPLPPESDEMKAMLAYMGWLGQGLPEGHSIEAVSEGPIDNTLEPDPVNGEVVYARQCAACHGINGEGMKDQFGDYIHPPLWGDDSFNIGAGMARLYKAAAFVKHNMPVAVSTEAPLGQVLLSDQDAVDVAWYFTQKPRPDFAGKAGDWPDGNKPKDARY